MNEAIWWIGVVHVAVYAIVGTSAVGAYLLVKAHMLCKVMGKVIRWDLERLQQRMSGEKPGA